MQQSCAATKPTPLWQRTNCRTDHTLNCALGRVDQPADFGGICFAKGAVSSSGPNVVWALITRNGHFIGKQHGSLPYASSLMEYAQQWSLDSVQKHRALLILR